MEDGEYIDIYAYRQYYIYMHMYVYIYTCTHIHIYTYPQLYHQALNAHGHICYKMQIF